MPLRWKIWLSVFGIVTGLFGVAGYSYGILTINFGAAYGLGNDGNEFKIITQVFLYKFLNDKFAFEAKKIRPDLAKADSWEQAIAALSANELEMLQLQMGPDTARLKPEHSY